MRYLSQRQDMKSMTTRERRLMLEKMYREAPDIALPSGFSFATFAAFTRIYALHQPTGSSIPSICFVDVPNGVAPSCYQDYVWERVFDARTVQAARLSKEEQLRAERQRGGARGVTHMEVQQQGEEGALILACISGRIFLVKHMRQGPCQVHELLSPAGTQSEARIDAKLSPDGHMCAYVRAGELNVAWLAGGRETQVSVRSHAGCSSGVPDYIMQEEFSRYTGYWWSPEVRCDDDATRSYAILYEEVDESEVAEVHLPQSDLSGAAETMLLPQPGQANASVALWLAVITVRRDGTVSSTRRRLGFSLTSLFATLRPTGLSVPPSSQSSSAGREAGGPELEYVVRLGWVPGAKKIFVQMLDRRQSLLLLVLVNVSAFVEGSEVVDMRHHSELVVAEYAPATWINISDAYTFLSEGQLVWSSERSGYRHLYLLEKGRQGEQWTSKQLTHGEWQVDNKRLIVDHDRSLVLFMGTKDSPLERHLYAVSFVRPGDVTRLTPASRFHDTWVAVKSQLMVSLHSTLTDPYRPTVFALSEGGLKATCLADIVDIQGKPASSSEWSELRAPELFSVRSKEGVELHGLVFLPPGYQEGSQPLPTVLHLYGGPCVQLVSKRFKGKKYLNMHVLASAGYAVVILDNRGSSRRGVAFESCLKHRLGRVEVDDQVTGLICLANAGVVDLERVAVTGSSYGGYLALRCMIQRSALFKLAVSRAPVVDWRGYDTAYSERYLGLLGESQHAYVQSSIITDAAFLPEEDDRLLLIHGLIDENYVYYVTYLTLFSVRFSHMTILVEAMVKAGLPCQVQMYPNERHNFRNWSSVVHEEALLLSFISKNL